MKLNGAVIPDEFVRRVVQRRGTEHCFADLDPVRTALVVIDLQHAFMNDAVGHAVVPTARDIVQYIARGQIKTLAVYDAFPSLSNRQIEKQADWYVKAQKFQRAVANDPAKWELHAKRTFIGRNGKLDDLTGTAVYLASRASDYVTGQTIFVDGGYSAG